MAHGAEQRRARVAVGGGHRGGIRADRRDLVVESGRLWAEQVVGVDSERMDGILRWTTAVLEGARPSSGWRTGRSRGELGRPWAEEPP